MKRKQRILNTLILSGVCFFSCMYFTRGQSGIYSAHGWQLQDYRSDSVFGSGVNRAYHDLLKSKKAFPVIVAVIDAGLDTAHEDLIGHIWTNTKEIPGNGMDDDHNGYVDDIHGWNFLGGRNGRNITIESYESYRENYRLKTIPPANDYPDSLYR
jgi:cell wall-associated protease